MKARKTAPNKSNWDDEQAYRVWGRYPTYTEDERPWKCLAAFMYLDECIDYIRRCQEDGETVVFQSPSDVTEYGPRPT
jgi:hypothetical protein